MISILLQWASDIAHRPDLYQYALVAIPLTVTIGLFLLSRGTVARAIGAFLIAVPLAFALLLLTTLLQPGPPPPPPPPKYITLQGIQPFSVDIPSSFKLDPRSPGTAQRAISGNGDIIDFSSGSLSGSSSAYLGRRFDERLAEMCNPSSNYSVGTVYPDPYKSRPIDLVVMSWTDPSQHIDYYEVREAVETADGTHWAYFKMAIQLPNRTVFAADYARILDSLRNSAGVAGRPNLSGNGTCPPSPARDTGGGAPSPDGAAAAPAPNQSN